MAIIDTETLHGWVTRDENNQLKWWVNYDNSHRLRLPDFFFPDLKADDPPLKVEILLHPVNEDIAKRNAVIRILEYTDAINLNYKNEELIAWLKNLVQETDINAPTMV